VKKKFTKKMWLLTAIWLLMFIHLRYYKGSRFMGYVHYTFPFLIFYTGLALYSLKEIVKKKYSYLVGLAVFVLAMSPALVKSVESSNEVAEFNQLGEVLSEKYPGQKFRLYHCGT